MASNRAVGKGRVLGAAKPAPAAAPTSSAIPEHVRNTSSTGVVSPSESTVSLNSQPSASLPSAEENDISSAVALQARDIGTAASATPQMICPICGEDMVTLTQLNRHLDDAHKNLEDVEQDEVKTWFKTQVIKAKRFQPLAVFNQKLRGLEVFESNDEQRAAAVATPPNGYTSSGHSTPPPVVRQDPDEVVTREHWQRYTRDGLCSDAMCGKRLGGTTGNINCRKCGKLYCEEHTMYQMKLSRSANWEPVRGYWCRVCETCYKSREGYNDHTGFERDHMNEFSNIRRKAVDKAYLEVSRLEKRLTKLTALLADPTLYQEQGVFSYLKSFSGTPSQKRLLEQSVVDWEEDASVIKCPFCHQEFNYTFKRHHCRLCGRVVCADLMTQCSTEVALNVAAKSNSQTEKSNTEVPIDVRMCQDCKRTVFSKNDFARELATVPPDQRAFQNLKEFERGIRMMMPRFQKLLTTLQDPNKPPTPAQLAEATKVRKRLTDSFTEFSIAIRRIRDLPTTSPTQKRLQEQVHAQGSSFLHIHMLPLKSLPKTLKHAGNENTPSKQSSKGTSHLNAPVDADPSRRGHSPSHSVDSSSALSSLEGEEKELRERLIVLEEQKFMVGEMLADAQRRRKFEEVESLRRNVDDLNKECDSVQSQLEGVKKEFEGLYIGTGNPASGRQ